jgi:hypothetical protein
MRKLRKVAIVVIMLSLVNALAGCSTKQLSDEVTSSNRPTTKPTAGATASPSHEPIQSLAPPSTNLLTPQPTSTIVPSAKPQTTTSSPPSPTIKPPSFTTAAEAKQVITARAQETIMALKEHDTSQLANLVHPQKGVQFSPYSYIHTATDIQVQGSNLAALWASPSLTLWGTLDGSGDPIDLTMPNYWAKFVYNANFAAAPQIGFNTIIGKGNMINNVFTVYPTASYITVEYHFPGFDPQYQGMDWTSLRLVFEFSSSQWYLVAIVHDQHTM